MKLLLDEDVPLPLLELLQHVLADHEVDTSTAFIGRASKTETYTGIRKGVVTTQY